mgnify:FL=1
MNDILGSKTLVMIIAPSATGKSTVMDTVAAINDDFERVRGFTTRDPRPNDGPNQFFYLTKEELEQKRAAGELITEVTFPATGQVYGTLPESYNGHYCLLETLANSVDDYRALPFERTVTVSLTIPLDRWIGWFHERYPTHNEDAKKRLKKAIMSIQWSLAQTSNHYWLVNDGTPDEVAERLIDIVRGAASGDDGAPLARAIMEAALKEA